MPSRKLTISPIYGIVGTQVTVSGVSFDGYSPITTMKMDTKSVLPATPPIVGQDGSFSVKFTAPQLDAGTKELKITFGGVEYTKHFELLDALPPRPIPTATPTPRPTPAPTPLPKFVDAIQPLQNNLLRIWSYSDALGRWDRYDPRPGFAGSNNLITMTPGDLYWIRVDESSVVLLNGQERDLNAGWNLIHW